MYLGDMLIWKILLFGSWFIVAFNYFGYAILALIINKLMPRRGRENGDAGPISGKNAAAPGVTFIVAAYNESDCIRAKIANCRSLDYPSDRVEWLFVTDGSTDETPEIVRSAQGFRLLHDSARGGKSVALNRAVAAATHDLIICSDANTALNADALRLIARHYADPKVGGVAGEKKVVSKTDAAVGKGEGAYWKYESALKRIDSEFYSVVGAAGELFSFRKNLYTPVDKAIILDDFVISMRIAAKGYRIIYEPGAVAQETPSFSMEDESKRKVRIAAGGFQSVALLRGTVNPWKYPRLYYLYISHRVLRWVASPFCLLIAPVAGAVLWLNDPHPLYTWLFGAQAAFYLLGVLPMKAGRLPRYFLFMNASVIQGFMRWLKGGQSGAWEKARRA